MLGNAEKEGIQDLTKGVDVIISGVAQYGGKVHWEHRDLLGQHGLLLVIRSLQAMCLQVRMVKCGA